MNERDWKAAQEKLAGGMQRGATHREVIAWQAFTSDGKRHLIWQADGDQEWLAKHYERWEPLVTPDAALSATAPDEGGIAHDLETLRSALQGAVAAKEAELEGFRRNLGRDPLVKVEWLEAARSALKTAAPQAPCESRPSTPGPSDRIAQTAGTTAGLEERDSLVQPAVAAPSETPLRSILDRCHHAIGESEHSDDESLPDSIALHIRERNQRIEQLEALLSATPPENEWRVVNTQTGILHYEEVEAMMPITCNRNCQPTTRPYPVWMVTNADGFGCSTSALFEGLLKHFNGKRVRIAISMHPDDHDALKAQAEARRATDRSAA